MSNKKLLAIKPSEKFSVYNPATGTYLREDFNIVPNDNYWKRRLKDKSIEIIKEEPKVVSQETSFYSAQENIEDKEINSTYKKGKK